MYDGRQRHARLGNPDGARARQAPAAIRRRRPSGGRALGQRRGEHHLAPVGGGWAATRSRGDVPVQGILVTVSAEDLIRHDATRLEDQARVLRQRLDETVTTMQAFTPVFFVITKIEMIKNKALRDRYERAREEIEGRLENTDVRFKAREHD